MHPTRALTTTDIRVGCRNLRVVSVPEIPKVFSVGECIDCVVLLKNGTPVASVDECDNIIESAKDLFLVEMVKSAANAHPLDFGLHRAPTCKLLAGR